MKSKKKKQFESRPLVNDAADRIATIVDAAERAAAKVIDDAETQARQELENARARADRLAAARLRELADELDPAASSASQVGHPAPRLRAVEVEEPRMAEPEASPDGSPAGARLLATQMAVSGSSREEIDGRLRSGFGIEDPSAILDAILGPEG
ncbi:MAG TPA: hypothetical protein VNM89_09340 [Solirubrobacterales bacterium]|nr:hypothetical protein [Solirubrobacterales bacterium]